MTLPRSLALLTLCAALPSWAAQKPATQPPAPVIAADRDVEVRLLTDEESADYRNLITVRGTLTDGRVHSVSGTLAGSSVSNVTTAVRGLPVTARDRSSPRMNPTTTSTNTTTIVRPANVSVVRSGRRKRLRTAYSQGSKRKNMVSMAHARSKVAC